MRHFTLQFLSIRPHLYFHNSINGYTSLFVDFNKFSITTTRTPYMIVYKTSMKYFFFIRLSSQKCTIITHVVYNKCHSSIFTSYKFLCSAFSMSSEDEKGNLLYAFTSITSIRLYISHMMCHVHHVHNAVDGFN